VTGFADRARSASIRAVDKRADLLCAAKERLAEAPKTQWALAAAAAVLHLAAADRPSPEELQAAATQFDRWLADAAKPATTPRLRIVNGKKAS
jgi:hypothetical protein